MIQLFKKMFRPRIAVYFEPPMRATEKAIGLRVDSNNLTWRAVNDILREEIRQRSVDLTDPRLAEKPGELARAAGCVAALVEFKVRLTKIKEKADKLELPTPS